MLIGWANQNIADQERTPRSVLWLHIVVILILLRRLGVDHRGQLLLVLGIELPSLHKLMLITSEQRVGYYLLEGDAFLVVYYEDPPKKVLELYRALVQPLLLRNHFSHVEPSS